MLASALSAGLPYYSNGKSVRLGIYYSNRHNGASDRKILTVKNIKCNKEWITFSVISNDLALIIA